MDICGEDCWPDAGYGSVRTNRLLFRQARHHHIMEKCMQNAFNVKAYSAASETSPLASDAIPRRNPTERDVQIDILFCGICHSDLRLLFGRRSLSGSPIGGIAETQEMLDFCGEHNITAHVEVIPSRRVNEAYDRLLKADVKYRFSIDMASLKSE